MNMEHSPAHKKVLKSTHEVPEFNKGEVKTEKFDIDGRVVELESKEFSPRHEVPKDEAVIFLTGWAAGDAKTLEYLTGCFAAEAENTALQIRTSTEGAHAEALKLEARAIAEVIKKRALKHITLTSHSQGGTKAANLIAILQREMPEVEIRGLILMDPVGLYEQAPLHITKAFAKDSLISTPTMVAANLLTGNAKTGRFKLLRRALQAGNDILFNIMLEVANSRLDYLAKLRSQISALGATNENYRAVKCPVVLVQGRYDPVSDREKVLPSDQDPKNLTERSEILKDTFFPNSPRVDMLIPERLGHHGLPHFRPEEIARVSLYLLKREERRNKS